MLICPQCNYENPANNKFCERCGTSLTQKACPECGQSVPYTDDNCPHCGAFTAKIWWSVIVKEKTTPIEIVDDDVTLPLGSQTETAPGEEITPLEANPLPGVTETNQQENDVSENIQELLLEEKYLDANQRYRVLFTEQENLLEKLSSSPSNQIFQVKVVDEKPLQKSTLETILEEQEEAILAKLEKKTDNLSILKSDFWQEIGIPAIALPYIILQDWQPMIPEAFDTWSQNGYSIVLLEDRSGWKKLSEVWGSEQIPPAQILYWLDEMAGLWQQLAKVKCGQSLLKLDNLRLDEDQTICLQQLYPDQEQSQTHLVDLIQTWQLLFHDSGRTYQGELLGIFQEVIDHTLTDVISVREKIQAIARSYALEFSAAAQNPELIPEQQLTEQMFYNSPGDDQPTVVLPMQLLSLMNAGCTDIGRQRDHNEDYYGIQTQIKCQENLLGKTIEARGLYIVCDGMGGHAAGEVASAMATETLQSYFQDRWQDELPDYDTILEGILKANHTLYEVNLKNSRTGSGRMGTTLVMALIKDNQVAIAHVGDSRIYRVTRKSGLEQLTIDHEVGQREIQRGVDPEIAYSRHDAYQLTQALGPRDNDFVKPDIDFFEINEDTLLLLCSDGLSDNNLLENHWDTYLTPLLSSKSNLDQGLLKLINFGNEYNGHDNITGLIVRIKVRPILDQQQSLI